MSRSAARALLARSREQQGLELRLGGASYVQIAESLGMTPGGAYKAVDRALARQAAQTEEKADKLRRLELARLERLHLGLWQKAKAGDEKAVREVLRIAERRARLLGLDAPKRNELSGPQGAPLVIDYPALAQRFFDLIELTAERMGTDAPPELVEGEVIEEGLL